MFTIYKHNEYIEIKIQNFELFDYEFSFAQKVELILKRYKATKHHGEYSVDRSIEFQLKSNANPLYPQKDFIQVVGSDVRKNNSKILSFRIDCHFYKKDKKQIIQALKAICKSENINVFYYYELGIDARSNFMLFFSNGRQGIKCTEKQFLNIESFEKKLAELISLYKIQTRLISGMKNYPYYGKKTVEMIVDKSYFFSLWNKIKNLFK